MSNELRCIAIIKPERDADDLRKQETGGDAAQTERPAIPIEVRRRSSWLEV